MELKDINYIELLKKIGNVCMTEHICGTCQELGCFVGYARYCAGECLKKRTYFVQNGFEEIPHVDVKGGYDEQDALEVIAYTLDQCRGCKGDHNQDCLISIVRNCYEIIAFGDEQPYEGSTFQYLTAMQEKYQEQAEIIGEFYKEMMKKTKHE